MKISDRALHIGLFCMPVGMQAGLAAVCCGRFAYGLRGIVVPQSGLPPLAQVKRYAGTRSSQVDKKFSSACAFGVIWGVAPVDVSAFADTVRADGDPPSVVRQARQARQTAACPYRQVRTGAALRLLRRGPGAGAQP